MTMLEQPRRSSCRKRVVAAPRPQTAFGIGGAAGAAIRMPLTALLTGNAVNPGEIVQLVLKPSRWFILLNSIRFAAIVAIIVLGLRLPGMERFAPTVLSLQFAFFVIVGRVMWSTVQWMGRYYLLTDQRVIRVCGVFDVDIQAYPLREVQAIRTYRPFTERILNRGSLEIAGPDGLMHWQTIAQCDEIHEAVRLAVHKARYNGSAGGSINPGCRA